MKKLPVFASVSEVFHGVFTHFFQLVRVAWLPLIALIVFSAWGSWWVAQNFLLDPIMSGNALESVPRGSAEAKALQQAQAAAFMKIAPKFYGMIFLQYVILSIIAVGFHRFVLLGERVHGIAGTGFAFGRKELLYIWSLIKIALVAILLMIPAFILIGLVAMSVGGAAGVASGAGLAGGSPALIATMIGLYLAAMGALLLVMVRLLLVLPHVALGNAGNLRFIWRETRGNSWRLVGYMLLTGLCVGLGSLVVIVPLYSLLGLPIIQTPETIRIFADAPSKIVLQSIINIPVTLVVTMVTITMLSVAYREIVGLPSAMQPEPALPA